MKKIFYIVIFGILSLVILSGCEKQKLKKLEGTWELIKFTRDTTGVLQYQYTFQTEFTKQKIICYMDSSGSGENIVPVDSGEYMLDAKFDKTYIIFTGLHMQHLVYDGKWIVAELNKDILVLLTSEYKGQTTREFYRVE